MNIMKFRLLPALVLAAAATPVWAQSLGDIARQEEARRAAIAKPGKVYTNESLRSEPAPAPNPAPASPSTPQTPASTAPGAAAPGASGTQPVPPAPSAAQRQPGEAPPPPQQQPQTEETKTEANWRQRITEARDGLSRSQTLADALQSRVNALSADFVNRSDPAQREVISADRQKAMAELDRVKREMQDFAKSIAAIEEDARRAGIPPGWLR